MLDGYSFDVRMGCLGLVLVILLAGGIVGLAGGSVGAASDTAVNETVHSEVLTADGEQEILVYFGANTPAIQASSGESSEITVERLQENARSSQAPLNRYAAQTDGITVSNNFWLGNIAAVTIDHGEADIAGLASLEGVERISPNFEVRIDAGAGVETGTGQDTLPSFEQPSIVESSADTEPSSSDTTYGLEQINAPDVWTEYNTKGDGIKVAVLDTGVDIDHDDIDLYTEDSSDPTYPGGWAEFDSDGNKVADSEPHDTAWHGTHVSGTVAGADASGTHIGVAPNVDLMHGLVLPDGGGTMDQVIAGMEWGVEENANILSLSLGGDGYRDGFIDPVRDAQGAGTMVISSSGNDGEGTSSSPGNVYDATSVGMSDEDEEIDEDSSGEEIVTDVAWGTDAPDDWPDEYIVPTISAPGVDVLSAVPDNGHGYATGTSMAAPHVAGAVALLQSATDKDLTIAEIEDSLTETAFKPAGESSGQDTRYGYGIIDVKAATEYASDGEFEAPHFDVSIDSTNSPVSEGETIEVQAEVENTGDESDTQSITLDIDGAQTDSTELELDSGQTETVTLSWETESGDGGDHTATVTSTDDSDSTTVSVDEPASFVVSDFDSNEPVIAGETLEFEATIENTGDETDTQSIELSTDETERDSTELELAGGESATVSLEWETTEDDYGEHTATVASEDTDDSKTVTVREPDQFFVTLTGTNSPVVSEDTLTVEATIESTYDGEETQQIELSTADTVRDETTVTLERGEETDVTLDWETSEENEGDHTVTVASETDSDSAEVTVEKPGNYTVEITDTNSPVTEGEAMTVTASVHNEGNGTATQSVGLMVDDTSQETKDVTLEPDESTHIELDWETSGGDAGTHTVLVDSGDDTDSTDVTVEEAVSVAVNITETNEPVEEGEELTVNATVENTGDEETTQPITLDVNGTEHDSTNVTLSPGEEQTVALGWETESGDAGNQTVTVASIRESDSIEVTIESGDPALIDYANEDDVVELDGLRDAIADWRTGDIELDLLRDVIDAWRSGEPVT